MNSALRPARAARTATTWFLLACLLLPVSSLADFEAGREALDRGDYPVARRLLEAAGEAGDARAQTLLGRMYRDGEGVARNDARALSWFERAAALGDASAQYNLGRIYREGHGVPRDDVRAVEWYTQAAEQGLGIAQYFLARHHELGRGTRRDYGQAYLWFTLAALQGEPEAAQAADRLRESLTSTQLAWVSDELAARGAELPRTGPGDAGQSTSTANAGAGTPGGGPVVPDDVTPPAEYLLEPLAADPAAAPAIPALDASPDKTVVAAIQRALAARGYEPGPADGTPGGRTTAAVQAYQRDAGLPVDGQLTGALLTHLQGNTKPAPPTPALSGRALVKAVQQELGALGYQPGPADGLAGRRTTAAVKAFQKAHGLTPDGRITQALLDRIRAQR